MNYFLKTWSEEHRVWCVLCTESLCTIHEWLAHCTAAHRGLLADVMAENEGRVEVLNYKKCLTSCDFFFHATSSVLDDLIFFNICFIYSEAF